MPVLDNVRHELFCQHVASGKTHAEAALQAGYESKNPGVSAAMILKNISVVTRIQELLAAGAESVVMDVKKRAQILSEIANTKITDIYNVTPEGITLKSGEIPSHLAHAVSEIKLEEWSGGKNKRASGSRLTIKLYDKIDAIKTLNTMDGYRDVPESLVLLLQDIRGTVPPVTEEPKMLPEGHQE